MDIIISVLLSLLLVVTGTAAWLSSARAARHSAEALKVSVDAGAYTRAQQLYESSIATLGQEVTRLQGETSQLRAQISALQGEISALHGTNASLAAELAALRLRPPA